MYDPKRDEEAFSIMPPLGRRGLINLILGSIKEKNDARAVAAFATFLILFTPIVLGILGPIAAGMVFLATGGLSTFVETHPRASVLLAFIGGASILASIAALVERRRYNKRLMLVDEMAEFRILQCVDLCVVRDRAHIDYYSRRLVRARKSGVRFFDITYQWSGTGLLEIRLNNPAFSHTVTHIGPGNRQRLRIDLGRELRKGERELIDFVRSTDTTDGKEQLPFLTVIIASPKFSWFGNHLIAKIDREPDVVAVYRETFLSPIVNRVFSSDPSDLDDQGCVKWSFFPRLGWRYRIRWVYRAVQMEQ